MSCDVLIKDATIVDGTGMPTCSISDEEVNVKESKKRRTMEPEDLFRMQFLQGAQLSPDGKWVAYAVLSTDREKDEDRVAIWLLSVETGAARQLTAGLAKDSSPAWSPDGKRIAFLRQAPGPKGLGQRAQGAGAALSTRGEKPHIYVIPVDGGEARALTALEQGAGGGPVWSPDGTYIAFTAGPAVEPPDPTRPYRVTRHIYRFDAMGYLDNVVQDVYIVPAEGGEPKRLTDDACHNSMPVWSPDGQEILFSVQMFTDSFEVYYPKLKVVNLEGKVRELVHEWGVVTSAEWMPDGRRVVFMGQPHGQPPGSKNDLWVIDTQDGEPECRTADLGVGVGGHMHSDVPCRKTLSKILVTEDGGMAYVPVPVGGTVQLFKVALKGPESWAPVVTGERTCTLLGTDGERLLFACGTLHNPMDLFVSDMDGSNERQITRLNEEFLAGIQLPTVEHLLFPGSDGVQVEGWIMKPPAGEPPYPTILHIHGGPHAAYGYVYYFDYQMLAGAGYAVLFINHRASLGYGDEFATQIIGDWGNLDYKDLMAGVDYVIEKGIADPDRLGCCGVSGGGNLSCWIVGQTDRFKAAVPENPVTNFFSFYGTSDVGPVFAVKELGGLPHEIPEVFRRCSPITYAHRCATPTLLLQHECDWRCPAEQSEQFYAVLKASGCIVEMVRFPASSHGGHADGKPVVRHTQNEAILDWMNRYVLGKE
jgi:dipeptidyl aminopeptidase/acylaminoacyl peptidase